MTTPWTATTIGELFDIGGGKSVTPAARHGEPKHPFLRTANVFWGRIDLSEVDAMHYSKEELGAKTLKKGDLLVCEGGDIGRAAIWTGEIENCGFQNHLHRLRSKTAETSPRFYMYFLQAGFTQFGIYEGAGNKTTIPNLSRNGLASLGVPKPDRDEQGKIASILWKVQGAIEIQEKLVATTRELKQSAMQQVFARGVRDERQIETELGPLPESWSVRPLETLREFLQYGTSAKCDYHGKGNPVIRIPNVVDGRVSAKDLKWCELQDKVVASIILEEGDVLFIRTNAVRERVGRTAVYRGDPAQALFASYLIRARLKKDQLEPDFLQYLTMTATGASQLSGRASPAADGKFNINTKTIDSILVPLPSKHEQQEIVTLLKAIDGKIDIHERKRRTLKDLFNTLLNNLMTGEMRVADLDIDTSDIVIQ